MKEGMVMFKQFLRMILPPIVARVYRKFVPNRLPPMYRGTFKDLDAVPDENPWSSDQRIAFAECELQEILDAEKGGEFIPNTKFKGSSAVLPCFVANYLSDRQTCRVLDFGGGTGIVYYLIRLFLINLDGLNWHVVDNKNLTRIGEKYRSDSDNIVFTEDLPETGNYDIVFMSGSLQYVIGYPELVMKMFSYQPDFVVVTRVTAGDFEEYITCQNNIQGGKAPCMFIDVNKLIGLFEENGYRFIFKSPALEDNWDETRYEDIPDAMQLRNTVNLVFKRA